MLLANFSAPGNLKEMSSADLTAWSKRVSKAIDDVDGPSRHIYDPTKVDTPAGATSAAVTWPASPARLTKTLATPQRWDIADRDRNQQDEYCEWSVTRDGDKVTSVTFTTETPDYYDHLMDNDQDLLVKLYKQATGKNVTLEKIRTKQGIFNAKNRFNNRTDGPIVHLMQINNTLRAAITLAADATVLRKDKAGHPVRHPQSLVLCAGLGDERRHSDPKIAAAVNNLVADRFEVTIGNPPGLYLDGLLTAGFDTPDETDAQSFWTVERGAPGFAMRARFEVPADRDYAVGDITINGEPIRFGAQLADRVQVRIDAVAKPGDFQLKREPCKAGSGI